MQKIINQISVKLESIQKIIKKAEKSLENAPKGNLRIARRKNSKGKIIPQYYVITKKNDTKGRYLPQSEIAVAKKIAQRDYDKKVLELSRKIEKALGDFLKNLPEQKVADIFTENPERRSLIAPYVPSDDEFRRNWESQPYKEKSFPENAPEIFTEKGERVRSKSEKIIADKLKAMNVPYRYEAPLHLKKYSNSIILHPDFTILDVKNRREIIFEHFGMMNDSEYAKNTAEKINLYAGNGFYPGSNFFFTMETATAPLNMKTFEKLLKNIMDI